MAERHNLGGNQLFDRSLVNRRLTSCAVTRVQSLTVV